MKRPIRPYQPSSPGVLGPLDVVLARQDRRRRLALLGDGHAQVGDDLHRALIDLAVELDLHREGGRAEATAAVRRAGREPDVAAQVEPVGQGGGAVEERRIAAPGGVVFLGQLAVDVEEPAAGRRQVARATGLLAGELVLRVGVGDGGGGREGRGDEEGAHYSSSAPLMIQRSIRGDVGVGAAGPSIGMRSSPLVVRM
jgi:hypothetical protein